MWCFVEVYGDFTSFFVLSDFNFNLTETPGLEKKKKKKVILFKVQYVLIFFIIWWRQLEQGASMYYYATEKTTVFHSNYKKWGTDFFCKVVSHAERFFLRFFFSIRIVGAFSLHLTDLFSYRGVLVLRSPSWGSVWCNRGIWFFGKELKGRLVIDCKDNFAIWFYASCSLQSDWYCWQGIAVGELPFLGQK